jgi:hypothetical protein
MASKKLNIRNKYGADASIPGIWMRQKSQSR